MVRIVPTKTTIKSWIIVFFLLGALFLTLGILSYVFSEEATVVIYVATGALMCLVGVIQIIFGIVATVKAKKIADDIVNQTDVVVLDNEEPNPQIIDATTNDNNSGNADA